MSIDFYKSPDYHFELAKELNDLRSRGILIIGSGNIVHNLGRIEWEEKAKPYDWAEEFDETVKKLINERNFNSLVQYDKLGKSAQLSIPTNDHYLPLLYTLALAGEKESISYPFEGIQNGSISMRCVQIG